MQIKQDLQVVQHGGEGGYVAHFRWKRAHSLDGLGLLFFFGGGGKARQQLFKRTLKGTFRDPQRGPLYRSLKGPFRDP